MSPGEVRERLIILHDKLEGAGDYVGSNTVWLAMQDIKVLEVRVDELNDLMVELEARAEDLKDTVAVLRFRISEMQGKEEFVSADEVSRILDEDASLQRRDDELG